MSITHSFISTVGFPWKSLPFAGLGFDLEPVAAKAQTLELHPLIRQEPDMVLAMPPFIPRAFGYGLLVSLGRETRGR